MIALHGGVAQCSKKHLHHLLLGGASHLDALEELDPARGGLNAEYFALQCVLHHVAEERKQVRKRFGIKAHNV